MGASLSNSGEQTAERAIAKAKETVNGLVLNIAITGETGVGKSSFVNAIRGVQRGDEVWAPTGVIETTMKCSGYTDPSMPNVKIWDLPGIGSPSFDAKSYVKKVQFEKYDFFIIMSASRFKENDLKLANEIKKSKKKFYFVHSKIDDDVRNESKDGGETEEEILLKIRKDCEDNLRDLGGAPVFLITSNDLTKYDFPTLVETLKRDLPSEKRNALEKSLPVYPMEQAKAKAKEIVNALDEVIHHIAITGESGTGKSSFVNAIRGVERGDEGWAPTGVTETTMDPKMYPHPTMPNVRIWDLPGIGIPSFDAKSYVNKVHFEKYDFFIIVSASRFRENDLKLANEIKKKKKNFYFVRSKVDDDVRNERSNGWWTEEEILHKIRKYCESNLRDLGAPPVFLITSGDLKKFDFPTLVETLKRDLSREKRDAMVQSLPVYSMQSLNEKYSTFKKCIWALAVVSGGIGAAPVPGLSFALDTAMVLSFLTGVYHSFGLDDKTLKKMSDRVNKPILDEVKKSELIKGIGKSMLTSSMLTKLALAGGIDTAMVLSFLTGVYHSSGLDDEALERMSEQVEKKILEEVKKSELIQGIGKSMLTTSLQSKLAVAGGIESVSCLVPIAGNISAAGVSFLTTQAVLKGGLDELYGVAKKVLVMADLQ